VEGNIRMMYVEQINKGVKSIKRNSAIMTCKMDVGKEKIDKNKIKNAIVSS
ncbi:16632_t:CDS:1, partial [Gigaspora margarita]